MPFFQCLRFPYHPRRHRVGATLPLTAKRLMHLATLDGAVDLGIAHRTSSLMPCKRADIIPVRAADINMAPMGDPYEVLVNPAQPRNVDTVIANARILQRRWTIYCAESRAGIACGFRNGSGANRTRWTEVTLIFVLLIFLSLQIAIGACLMVFARMDISKGLNRPSTAFHFAHS